MSAWSDFYKDRMNERYRNHLATKYKPFIDLVAKEICKYSKKRVAWNTVLEAGCGTGNISRLLMEKFGSSRYPYFKLADNDADVLRLADANLREMCHSFVCTYNTNIKRPITIFGDFGVVFSHGVLEHFEDDDIRLVIKNQLDICKTLIHYVPSSKYTTKSFGDERLMSSEQWMNICKPNRIIKFNDGYDLILTWGVK